MTLESGKTYFEVIELLGEGLNSCVYTAIRKDVSGTIHQKVALKILKSENEVDFWRQEVESLLTVDTPYCVKVLGFEWVQGQPALVLEWVDGLTLTQLYRHFQWNPVLIQELALQIQEGLIQLHRSGLCHGDLNFSNIMISNTGQIKLLDFGKANIHRAHRQGSPAFMAPEVTAGQPPDFWSDLYSLGKVLEKFESPFASRLLADRESRDLLPGRSAEEHRIQLAELVISLQKRLQNTKAAKTQVLQSNPPSFPPKARLKALTMAAIIFGASVLLPAADGSKNLSSSACVVQIRTKKWVRIHGPTGETHYAPTSLLSSTCKPLTLHWSNHQKQGAFTVYFESQPVQLVTDEHFGL